MEPWMTDLWKAAGGAVVGVLSLWAVYKVQNKATRSTHQLAVTDRWETWARDVERRMKEALAEAKDAKAKAEALEGKVDRYREENGRFKSIIAAAVDWIERVLVLFEELGVKAPPLPQRIANLLAHQDEVDDRDDEDADTKGGA